jgi:PIN domain nuclease of toxin-antitoxin system
VRALLDTHAFLWWNAADDRLSERARTFIADSGNEIVLSAASAWEIALKAARGRLELPLPAARYVPERMSQDGFVALDIQLGHVLAAASLPTHHTDPFDRVLVAQAQAEGIPVITSDEAIKKYDVDTIW